MSIDYFLLTYTVNAMSNYEGDIEKATKVRKDIAEIEDWNKSKNNETTFRGIIKVDGETESSKRNSARNQVSSKFLEILKKHKANKDDVIIYCTMMIESVSESFEFEVKY